jgi:lipoprotein-anchoring transpeptidase ErfK/SrfK
VARPFVSLRTALSALALLAAGCGAESLAAQDLAVEERVPESSTTSAPTQASTTTTTAAPTTTTIPDPNRTLTATAHSSVESLVAFDEPDGEIIDLPFRVPNPHQFGGALTLMVTEGSLEDEWVKVQLPVRPNGQEAWIPTVDYNIGETTIRAEVTLSETSVKVFDGDELIAESQAAIGSEEAPTPLGTFYVAAKRQNPPEESYLGEWALVLSGYSEALPSFSGGLPVIAIHGTNNPDAELGEAISNGCVRVPNEVLQFLADHVPLGAPVIVNA